ncbi:hypothetical protein AQV86_00815 [Nanohaloarchaea archaeon SG9]|nr:hypothetical protein AQV86_00815 [Nanohaloarchaea archaeon SG9]
MHTFQVVSGHGHSGESEYAPSNRKKMAANFVAGSIIAVARFVFAIFRMIFNFLSALVGVL